MDPLTIITVLSQFAPAILKHFGAGASAVSVAEKAGDVARAITGSQTTEDAISALKANPELQLAFNKAILDQETSFETLYISDKASARARDMELIEKAGANNRANWLVAFAVLTISAIVAYIAFAPVLDEFAKNTLILVLGLYIGELKNIYAFEFGTTRRSAEKDGTIASLTDKI